MLKGRVEIMGVVGLGKEEGCWIGKGERGEMNGWRGRQRGNMLAWEAPERHTYSV